ncbi:putative orfan [Tupanvirus soda lake]|uniref:Orfan n=2 Tax=Tupanvirus TaxID=2094720 RepID=A0AC62ACG4_9VIRU|nr:putative orfan [Tupanvirus soda lake]QKU35444.1 putative orfan [Tupanvirus soda lake]
MSNCNILPMIIIAVVVIVAFYFLSQNDLVAPAPPDQINPDTGDIQEGFYPYSYNYGYGYPSWYYRNYPYSSRWNRYNYYNNPYYYNYYSPYAYSYGTYVY